MKRVLFLAVLGAIKLVATGASRPISWAAAAGSTTLSSTPACTLQKQVSSPLIGRWTLCSTYYVRPTKNVAQRTRADTTRVVSNVCTEVVFQEAGRGYAGLENGPYSPFTWHQQQATVTITYLGSPDATRFQGGVYQLQLGPASSQPTSQPGRKLYLSNSQQQTHLLVSGGHP